MRMQKRLMRMQELAGLLIVVVGSLVASTASATITDGLVGYWSFNQDFTATITGVGFTLGELDGVPEPFDSAPTIDTAAGNWQFGGGAGRFVRASSQRIDIQPLSGDLLGVGSAYSYSAWYRLANDIAGSDRHFVMETRGATFPISYGTRLDAGAPKGQVFTHTSTSTTTSLFVDNGATQGALADQWHHIVVTYDPTLADNQLKAYLDGTFAGEVTVSPTMSASPGLIVGGHRSEAGRNFDGWIDEVAVWNRPLTSGEVAALNASPIPEPASLILVAIGAIGATVLARRKMQS